MLDDTDSAQGTQGTPTGTPRPDDPKDTTSELTLPRQNPRFSFFDEEYVAGRRVPFPALHSDSYESSPDKTLCLEKLEKTSSSDKTAGSKKQPMDASSTSNSNKDGIRKRPTSEVAASAAVKSVARIRDSIHDALSAAPSTHVPEVAVVNENKPGIVGSRKSARNTPKKVYLDISIDN